MESRVTVPLEGGIHGYDALLRLIADAPLVLIGEATHGTHEFYHARAATTSRLWKRSAGSSAFLRGCGAMPQCSTS